MTEKKTRTGRPPLRDAAASNRVTVCMTAGQRLKLQRVATARGRPISTQIREWIDDAVERDGRPDDD